MEITSQNKITSEHIRVGTSEHFTTALVNAAVENSVEKVRTLLKQGFNPFIKTIDSKPRTPLQYALRFDCLQTAVVLKKYMKENPHLILEVLSLDNE